MTPNRLSIRLDLELDGADLRGRASLEGGEPRPFHGRLGLISVVDALLEPATAPAALLDQATTATGDRS
jgi:hypothetical protein